MTVQFRHIMLMIKDVPAAANFYSSGVGLEMALLHKKGIRR
jgi:catechol 2,3-dioxygenase-like lactoylglutathione lyase family enzyme